MLFHVAIIERMAGCNRCPLPHAAESEGLRIVWVSMCRAGEQVWQQYVERAAASNLPQTALLLGKGTAWACSGGNIRILFLLRPLPLGYWRLLSSTNWKEVVVRQGPASSPRWQWWVEGTASSYTRKVQVLGNIPEWCCTGTCCPGCGGVSIPGGVQETWTCGTKDRGLVGSADGWLD